MIEVFTRPPWREDWTRVAVDGEHEDSVLNLLVVSLLTARHEVEMLDSEGNQVPYLEYDHE